MLEKKLAALGLKDPWIRNEVWRFDRGFQPTMWGNAKMLFKRFVLAEEIILEISCNRELQRYW